MNLSLTNAIINDNVYSWIVSIPHYKIKSITVLSSNHLFKAKYNEDVEQFIQNGRTDCCPAVFSGDFSVYFFENPPFVILTDIQDIHIEIMECSKP